MRTRNGRRKVLFGTNYPMIFHEPALADLEALAPRRRVPYLSANALRLFEGGPRRLLCLGERERAGQRVWCPQRTMRSHLMGSARPLHPPGVAEVGRGQRPRLVLRQSGSGSERETTWCLHSLVRRGAQQAPVPHDSTTGAIVSARDVALSLPPKRTCGARPGGRLVSTAPGGGSRS